MKAIGERRHVLLAAIIAVGGVIMAWGPDPWVFMMARAFLLQWTILVTMIAIISLLSRNRPVLAASVMAALLGAWVLYEHRSLSMEQGTGATLKVLHMNVYQPNMRHEEVIQIAHSADADILCIQEVDEVWERSLVAAFSKTHPHHVLQPSSNFYGLAVFSRIPLHAVEVIDLYGNALVKAVVELDGTPVSFFTVHTTSPDSPADMRNRDAQLGDLAGHVRNVGDHVFVVGDVNAVPWHRAFQEFRQRSGLTAITGSGFRTWTAHGPTALIPLDHLFISKELRAAALERITIPGSDHHGLLAHIHLRQRE